MILFVDDERRVMDSYVQYLRIELDYEIKFLADVDQVLDFFNQRMEDIELIVLDIMMPPGKFADRTNGLSTGFLLYQAVRQRAPVLPVIVFTNSVRGELHENLMQDPHLQFLAKVDWLPDALAEEIRRTLSLTSTGK